MISIEQIAKLVIDETKRHPWILGSQLGFSIKSKFPDVRLKEKFGGLHSFVEKHCAGEVMFVGKHGLDDIYRHASVSAADNAKSDLADTSIPAAKPTFWSMFTDPRSAGKLWLKRSSAELEVAIESPNPVEDWLELRRLGTDDYREIAKHFLERVESEDREHFALILQTDEFWNSWSSAIRTMHAGRYQKTWVEFRREAICEAFRTRVKDSGLDENAVAQATAHFESSRHPPRSATVSLALSSRLQGLASTFSPRPVTNSLLRSTAAMVIAQMSEEELRGLWLPLGLVTDALRGRRS